MPYKDKIKARNYLRSWKLNHPEKVKAYQANFYLKHPQALKISHKKYRLTHQLAIKEQNKKYRLEHHEHHKSIDRKYHAKQYYSNSIFRLRHIVSVCVWATLKNKSVSKNGRRWETLLGYSAKDLKAHIEKQFTSQMNWENQGSFWNLDHIVPLSWFKTPEQGLKRGWALKNLQPLEAKLNFEKQDFYVGNPKTGIDVIYS